MYCKNSNLYEKNDVQKAQISVLTPKEDDDFIVRKIKLSEGGSIPNHVNKIQHQQYVLSGEAKVVVGKEVYHAKEGDFIYIPVGINHYYNACYNSDYEFLCMITTKEDEITML